LLILAPHARYVDGPPSGPDADPSRWCGNPADPRLYEGSDQTYLDVARMEEEGQAPILLIGHNPATHALASSMVAAHGGSGHDAMAKGFPTAALAVIMFDAERWHQVERGTGRLEAFIEPTA